MFPNYNISNRSFTNNLLYVTITIEDEEYEALIDTGSGASFIKNSIVTQHALPRIKTDHEIVLKLLNDFTAIIDEFTIINFTANHHGENEKYKHKVLIIPTMEEDIILGIDFCKSQVSYINFEENTIKIGNANRYNEITNTIIIYDNELINILGTDPENEPNEDYKFEIIYNALFDIPTERTRPGTVNVDISSYNIGVNYYQNKSNETTIQNNDVFDFNTIIKTEIDENRIELLDLIHRYRHLFAVSMNELSKAKGIEHKFELTDYKPINKAPYRTSAKEKEIIKTQVNEMLDQGVIRPSISDYASPVVLVKKKNGDMRFCVDNRALNAVTVKDRFPLPLIDDLIHHLQGCHYISTWDLFSGYWQVPIKEDHKKYTAFICSEGLFEFNVLNFGLTNAPAVFQRLMQKVFSGYLWVFVLCYIDDIVIYSKTFEDHLKHIELAFKRLEEFNLKLQPKKCVFLPKLTKFLGYIISENGIEPDTEKIQSVKDFPTPKNQRQVRAFLGLSGYYRSMIKNYAKVAKPLTNLLKHVSSTKNSPVEWTENCELAFLKLKESLTSKPILAHYKQGDPLILYTDASDFAMGWVLHQIQEGIERVLVYGSKTFTPTQSKYCSSDKECLAIVTAVIKLRHFLAGESFIIRTDHHALCWLMRIKDVSGRLARYSLRLQEYDFKIEYKSGKAHSNCDTLSRFPMKESETNPKEDDVEEIPVYTAKIIEYKCSKDDKNCLSKCELQDTVCLIEDYPIATIDEIGFQWTSDVYLSTKKRKLFIESKEAAQNIESIPNYNIEELNLVGLQTNDYWISNIKNSLAHENSKLHEKYEIHNNLVYRKTFDDKGQPKRLLCVPHSIRQEVLQEIHGGLTGGHFGFFKVAGKVRDRFYWPKRDKTIRKFLRSCTCCQFRKIDQGKPKGLLQPISIDKPFDLVGMDITGPLPKTADGKRYLLSAVDYATRFAIVDSSAETKAEDIANFFVNKIVSLFGCPKRILTDQGRQFIAAGLEKVLKYFNTDHSLCSKYHPQTQGLVERQNRTLIDSISMYCTTNQRNWSTVLPYIQLAHNSSKNKSTQFTPYYALIGVEPTLPIDISLRLDILPNFKALHDRWSDARELIKKHLKEAQRQQKADFDKKHREVIFNVGDLVAVYKKVRKVGVNEKMSNKYTGPWIIKKKYDIPENLYQVEDANLSGVTENVPVVRLKKWYNREEDETDLSDTRERQDPSNKEEDAADVYDVQDLSEPDFPDVQEEQDPDFPDALEEREQL